MLLSLVLYLSCFCPSSSAHLEDIDLPLSHMPYFLFSHPDLIEQCKRNKKCKYKTSLDNQLCWGYEDNCPTEKRFSTPHCPQDPKDYRFSHKKKKDQIHQYWLEADFGFILDKKNEMKSLCKPHKETDSSLECSRYLTFCRARHLYLDFRTFDPSISEYQQTYYHEIHFKKGEFGGFCQFLKEDLNQEKGHSAPGFTLSSWYDELKYFSRLEIVPSNTKNCDVIVNEPTYFLKLDAGVNLYHHFCNYLNIYLTQHLNSNFSKNINLVYWHPGAQYHWDVSPEVWDAFSNFKLQFLQQYGKKRVCFKEAYFSLLPRMVLGLYYSTPLVGGCHSSGMFKAFSEFILHRLGVKRNKHSKDKIRITFLSRSSSTRAILNYNQLISSLNRQSSYQVKAIDFTPRISFLEQVKISSNTDLFIGIHGAGLTHCMFLPDWGALFEIYNCGDADCYKDLAELRGLKYITWSDPTKVKSHYIGNDSSHPKFHNFTFDEEEFLKLVKEAATLIKNDSRFLNNAKKTLKEEL